MSDERFDLVHETTDASISGQHPAGTVLPILAGPATKNEFNTIKDPLIPIACWRLDDIRFDFDSSFVLPDAASELKLLAVLIKNNPKAPLSIFGHADPVGNDSYNKQLSGRRATAIYGLLTRKTELWEELYSNSAGNDRWGTKSIQTMETTLGLPPSSTNTSATRAKLFLDYMDKICCDLAGKPFQITKNEFLAQGADKKGKGDYQGCSEFNPVLMFSKTENAQFEKDKDKTKRNEENAPNRRVVILLFRPGSKVTPAHWPCPSAKDGISGCQKRFWSDHATRRTFQAKRRTHETDKDTFACRFYERLTDRSPCEGAQKIISTKIVFQLYPGLAGADGDRGIADVPYTLRAIGVFEKKGKTAADGSIPVVIPANASAVLEIFDSTYALQFLTSIEAGNTMKGVQQRLVLLGYDAGAIDGTASVATDDSILRLQGDNALDTDGDSGFEKTDNVTQSLQDKLKALVGE